MSQIENLSCHLLLRNISIKICLKSDLKQHFMLIFIDDGFFEALIWSDTLKYKKNGSDTEKKRKSFKPNSLS